MKISQTFFERDPVKVAKDLIGSIFVHKTKSGIIKAKIVETEAYGNTADLASHARFGPTERNKLMFGPAGYLYVYKIYGIFNLTNIICGKENEPGGVLIRSAEIIKGTKIAHDNLSKSKFVKIDHKLATGPGKFSLALSLDLEDNGLNITKSNNVYLETNNDPTNFAIINTTRIGVNYAKTSKDLPWRFYLKDSKFVSKL